MQGQNGIFEVIEVNSLEVACDGSALRQKNTQKNYQKPINDLGHPKVYLHIDEDKGEVTCPYCSRQYVLRLASGKYEANH